MNREDLVQNFSPPILPSDCVSVKRWKKWTWTQKDIKNPKTEKINKKSKFYWLGGRLTHHFSDKKITLQDGSCEVICYPSDNCCLFLNLKQNPKQQKKITWKKAFSILKPYDCVSVQVFDSFDQKKTQLLVKKILLTSLSNQKKISFDRYSFYFRNQKKWFVFLKKVQQILKEMGLNPVETPSLVDCPGTEPDLEVFKTNKYCNGQSDPVFLPSSPEMNLKKLLCQGWTDFYEIKKCFRNQESGFLNSCEFYLLEWYRTHSDWQILIEDVELFLHSITNKWQDISCPSIKKTSMKALFKKYLNMDLYPYSSKKDFIYQLKKMAIPFDKNLDNDDLFYLLFLNGIEPALDKETPLIIYHYPPFQRAYSRISSDGWARRFELFWKGMELANAFDEIICPKEQYQVFQKNLKKRNQSKKTVVPLDYQLLHEMQKGMPPSAGIAFGLDRLFLILNQLNNIHNIRTNFLNSSNQSIDHNY